MTIKIKHLAGRTYCSARAALGNPTKTLRIPQQLLKLCLPLITLGLTATYTPHALAAAPTDNELFHMSLQELLEVTVATGRVGSGERTKVDTSYSITRIDAKTLRMQAPSSVVDAVKAVPGFWIEGSGGDASENIRARGIPNSGFQSVNLLEDGIPVQHDPYPNGMTSDQSFRLDETIERIEIVRGGPSSTFYAYAPAGVINFIPRRVGDTASSLVKVSIGDDDLTRADFWYGTPLSNGWKASIGGFYREGEGLRDPGYKAYQGGQLRIGLARDWGKGNINIDLKHLDDTVPFYIDGPLQKNADGSINSVAGYDAASGNYVGPEFQKIPIKRTDGSNYLFNSAEGTQVQRDQLSIKLEQELASDWHMSNTLRLSDTASQRNDVSPVTVASTSTFLQGQTPIAAQYGASQLELIYANSGLAYAPGNDLLMTARIGNNSAALKELSNDLQLHRTFEWGSQPHDLSFGYTYSNYHQNYETIGAEVLMAAQNQAPLLGITALNGDSKRIELTDAMGVLKQSSAYGDDQAKVLSHAVYISDEWQLSDQWRIDSGIRWERAETSGQSPVLRTLNQGSFSTRSMIASTGDYTHFSRTFSDTGWTLGANYQLNTNSGIFARITPTYRLPGLNSFIPNETARTQITQTMLLGEIGYKYTSEYWQLYPTLFYTTYDNVTNNSSVYSPTTNQPITQVGFATTKTQGLELEGRITPSAYVDFAFSATWQDARYRNYAFTNTVNGSASELIRTDYSGNRLVRVPKWNFRLVPGVNLLSDKLHLQLAYEYAGKRFIDTANSVVLPAYDLIDISAQYQLSAALKLYAYIDNITNSEGLTEGNPRAGEIQSADAGSNVFLARAIFGRRFRLALKYEF